MSIGELVDFFEPTAFLHGGPQVLCDDARRAGGILLPRKLLFAAWVGKSHWRRSPSLTQARACASCLRCPSLASNLMLPFQPRWSAPPRLISSTRHQRCLMVEGVEHVPSFRLSDEPRRAAAFLRYCVYGQCSRQIAQTALCPVRRSRRGHNRATAASF